MKEKEQDFLHVKINSESSRSYWCWNFNLTLWNLFKDYKETYNIYEQSSFKKIQNYLYNIVCDKNLKIKKEDRPPTHRNTMRSDTNYYKRNKK